jgi:hypothetical protein
MNWRRVDADYLMAASCQLAQLRSKYQPVVSFTLTSTSSLPTVEEWLDLFFRAVSCFGLPISILAATPF